MSRKSTRDSKMKNVRRTSNYEVMMRKFSEAHKEECKSVSIDIPKVNRAAKQYPTGSKYTGSWDVLGMSGKGTYTFPNGVIYEGEFDDGVFDGDGELQYPDGGVLKGRFRRGRMVDRTLVFADGLHYSEYDWLYCQSPDRRFTIEYDFGINPAEESYLTADQPPRPIPAGHYDCGDGFYNPDNNMVYRADDITAIVRTPSKREEKWILENCRMASDDEIGPRSDLYESWVEPDVEPEDMPIPACKTRLTEHIYDSFNRSLTYFREFDTQSRSVSISDYSKWLEARDLSF